MYKCAGLDLYFNRSGCLGIMSPLRDCLFFYSCTSLRLAYRNMLTADADCTTHVLRDYMTAHEGSCFAAGPKSVPDCETTSAEEEGMDLSKQAAVLQKDESSSESSSEDESDEKNPHGDRFSVEPCDVRKKAPLTDETRQNWEKWLSMLNVANPSDELQIRMEAKGNGAWQLTDGIGSVNFVGYCPHHELCMPDSIHVFKGHDRSEAETNLEAQRRHTVTRPTALYWDSLSTLSLFLEEKLIGEIRESLSSGKKVDVPTRAMPQPHPLIRAYYDKVGVCVPVDKLRSRHEGHKLVELTKFTDDNMADTTQKFHGGSNGGAIKELQLHEWNKESHSLSRLNQFVEQGNSAPVTLLGDNSVGKHRTTKAPNTGSELKVKVELHHKAMRTIHKAMRTIHSSPNNQRRRKSMLTDSSNKLHDMARCIPKPDWSQLTGKKDVNANWFQSQSIPNVYRNGDKLRCTVPPEYNSKPMVVYEPHGSDALQVAPTRIAYCGQCLGPALHYAEISHDEYMKDFDLTCRTVNDMVIDFMGAGEGLHSKLESSGLFDPQNMNFRAKLRGGPLHHGPLLTEGAVSAVEPNNHGSTKVFSSMYGLAYPPAIHLQQIALLARMSKSIEDIAHAKNMPFEDLGLVSADRIAEAFEIALKWEVRMINMPDAEMLLSMWEEGDWPCMTKIACVQRTSDPYWRLIPASELNNETHFALLKRLWKIAAHTKLLLIDSVQRRPNQQAKATVQDNPYFLKVSVTLPDDYFGPCTQKSAPKTSVKCEGVPAKRKRKIVNFHQKARRLETVYVSFDKVKYQSAKLRTTAIAKVLMNTEGKTHAQLAAEIWEIECSFALANKQYDRSDFDQVVPKVQAGFKKDFGVNLLVES